MLPCEGFVKINLLNTGRSDVETEWNYIDVISIFTRLFYCLSGEAYIYINNNILTLTQGTAVMIPSYIRSSYVCNDFLSIYYIHIINEMPNNTNLFDIYSFKYLLSHREDLRAIFEELISMHSDKELPTYDPKIYQQRSWMQNRYGMNIQPSVYYKTQGLMLQLLSNFIDYRESFRETYAFSRYIERKIFTYIGNNIHHPIDIKDLADKCGYSADHFSRLFKKHFNLSPKKYILQRKIEYAQMLLKTTTLPIKEIANMAGFENQPYFSTQFRKISGYKPSELRRNTILS